MDQKSESALQHNYPFDPTHGYDLERLLKVEAPGEPQDYESFWRERFAAALALKPKPAIHDTGRNRNGWRIFDWNYTSTGATHIRGWVLLPESGVIRRAFVIGHGYSGRGEPDFDLPLEEAALFFPCARGLGKSSHPEISADPQWHVLHNIQCKRRYVLGGCVEDVWMAVSAALRLFPEIAGHIGYLGLSFSGGIGVMALAWDDRIGRGHFNVPTFGNQPLRMELDCVGSAASVRRFARKCPEVPEVQRYYDAATAARHIRVPVHFACAAFDPAVPPAGQFSIYNAVTAPKSLFVLAAGHHPYPGQESKEAQLRQEVHNFFSDL